MSDNTFECQQNLPFYIELNFEITDVTWNKAIVTYILCLKVILSVCTCMYPGSSMHWSSCEGQRTISSLGIHLSSCWRQGVSLLSADEYHRPVGVWVPGDLSVSASCLTRGMMITNACWPHLASLVCLKQRFECGVLWFQGKNFTAEPSHQFLQTVFNKLCKQCAIVLDLYFEIG